ncbi:MAG: riboflavin synthase [Vicinamibacterales bacterium]
MFTGLIERVGAVVSIEATDGGRSLAIDAPFDDPLTLGESVSVNGVCLTVVTVDRRLCRFDVSPETLAVTSLGAVRAGSPVNLERAVRADTRMGGHFVQGHVDATGAIRGIDQEGEFWRVTVGFPAAFAGLLIPRGAVAVDGISLTVAALHADAFDVQIVPHTWRETNLHARRAGDVVNLEFDMLGKYVVRALSLSRA